MPYRSIEADLMMEVVAHSGRYYTRLSQFVFSLKNFSDNSQITSSAGISLLESCSFSVWRAYVYFPLPLVLDNLFIVFQKGAYGTVSEVAGDMNIMFENAKKYNRPECKLYKVRY